MTLNCGIQKGTVLLDALAVGVALGVAELDVVVVPDDEAAVLDDITVVPDGTEVHKDGAEGNDVPTVEENGLSLLNVEGTPELTLLRVVGKEAIVLGVDSERLVSVLVVCRDVLVGGELREGAGTLAETIVEVDRVDNDVTGEELLVLPRLEGPGVWVDGLEELGVSLDVDVESFPDEMLAEETVDVTSVEVLSVPETTGELTILLLTVVGSVWLCVIDVNETEEDCPMVSVVERLLVPDGDSDDEPLTRLVVDEATWLLVSDPVDTEVPDVNEDVHDDTGTLGLSSVLIVEAIGGDEDS